MLPVRPSNQRRRSGKSGRSVVVLHCLSEVRLNEIFNRPPPCVLYGEETVHDRRPVRGAGAFFMNRCLRSVRALQCLVEDVESVASIGKMATLEVIVSPESVKKKFLLRCTIS